MSGSRLAAARGVVWVVLESGGVSLLSLATLLVLARLIGPAEFGLAGLALSIVQVLYLVAEMLFHDALVQRRDLDDRHADSALWASLLLGAGMAAGCWFLAPAAERLFEAPGLAPVLAWMGLSLVFGGANGVMTALLRRDLRFKRVAARSLFGRLAGAAAGLALALWGFGVWALVAQQIAMAAAATLALWIDPPRRPRLVLSLRHLRELLGFALPAFVASFLWQANLRLFVLIVGYLLGPAAVGYLTVAMRLVDTARMILGSALHQLALPLFSRRQDDREALSRGFRQATELTALVTQPLFAGLFALAPEVVALVLGPGWDPAVPLVRILCIVAMAQLVRQFGNAALTAVGRPRWLAVQNAIGLAVSVALLVAFGEAGVVVAAAVWAARFVAVLPLNAWMVRVGAGVRWRDQFGPAALPVAGACLMAALLLAARLWLVPHWPALPALALLVPAGALFYLALVLLIDRGPLARLAAFAAAALGRPAKA
ncbi:lipopolysaccharide biosynthesis protein [Rhodospirillum centenum]|uniref:Polysaccharide biosynthesis protein, putative n=1 Tax=Rhodospirillum centenum (strain ATCC 51521 / SW) TaxID=414684 RepID=B6IPD1_RHOCS|nr:lipopolysaccharide biosynthesis protein [Rhodospirillum centenum]ACI99633.1 polysaccharide biosynthesis protein, putative [Rhodospirillum centenum SW]